MKLTPISPPLRKGQKVWCCQGQHWTTDALAVLDAPPFTFICREHEQEVSQ